MAGPYCSSRLVYRRRPTREVMVGDVGVGGSNPIRVQSMTTPATTDVGATVEQIERLVAVGCEIVRVTVPTRQDAEAIPVIRGQLLRRSLRVPLVADIHFSPQAALYAVEHVEKVRINPGNYADRKRFEVREYTDVEYADELERVRERFLPLVDRARELGVAMRIGTNHGSLSDRIVNRFGDSPEGMVESALEFVRIAEDRGYRDIILSMKASNPQVVIRAYRLLAARLAETDGDYPFHLGVTEAGAGEDGRIKSAVGIGALLDDGLGDTVRVSLTEDPVEEVPVAFRLVEALDRRAAASGDDVGDAVADEGALDLGDPYRFERRPAARVTWGRVTAGGQEPPRVEVLIDEAGGTAAELAAACLEASDGEAAAEVLAVPLRTVAEARCFVGVAAQLRERGPNRPALAARPEPGLMADPELRDAVLAVTDRLDLLLEAENVDRGLLVAARERGVGILAETRARRGEGLVAPVNVLLAAAGEGAGLGVDLSLSLRCGPGVEAVIGYRYLSARTSAAGLRPPFVLVDGPGGKDHDRVLDPARRLGSLLVDGIGDALRLEGVRSSGEAVRRAYDILQATRRRISKVEYISCPSCGRTLFDLETVTGRIRAVTGHLKDLKIAVMGCVVNGPGEMADADFGYVGWGPGRVALFVGKECVEKDVPSEDAPGRLVELIRRHGRWREPPDAGKT